MTSTPKPAKKGAPKGAPVAVKGVAKRQRDEQRELKKAALVEAFKTGLTVDDACRAAECDDMTMYRWMEKDAEFADAIKKARAMRADVRRDAAEDAVVRAFLTSWQAAAWWLERNYQDQFALRNKREEDYAAESNVRGVRIVSDAH